MLVGSMASSPTSESDRVWDEFLLLISSREEARVAVQSEADSLGWTLYHNAGVWRKEWNTCGRPNFWQWSATRTCRTETGLRW